MTKPGRYTPVWNEQEQKDIIVVKVDTNEVTWRWADETQVRSISIMNWHANMENCIYRGPA